MHSTMARRQAAPDAGRPVAGAEPLLDGPVVHKFYSGVPLGLAENLLSVGFIRVEAHPTSLVVLSSSCASSASPTNTSNKHCNPQAQDRAETEWTGEDSFYWPLKQAYTPCPWLTYVALQALADKAQRGQGPPPLLLCPQTHEEAVQRVLHWDKRASASAPQYGEGETHCIDILPMCHEHILSAFT